MKETGLTGKRRSTTIAATPDDGESQRKRREGCDIEALAEFPGFARDSCQIIVFIY